MAWSTERTQALGSEMHRPSRVYLPAGPVLLQGYSKATSIKDPELTSFSWSRHRWAS